MTESSRPPGGDPAGLHSRLIRALRVDDQIDGRVAARLMGDRLALDPSGAALEQLLELVDQQLSWSREEHPDRLVGATLSSYLGLIENVLRSARQRILGDDADQADQRIAIEESEVLTRIFRAQCVFDDGGFDLAESLVVEALMWPMVHDTPAEVDLREAYGEVLLRRGETREGLFELGRAAQVAGEHGNLRAAAILHDRLGQAAAQAEDDAASADAFSAAGVEWAGAGEPLEADESNRSALYAAIDAAQSKAADGHLEEGARFLAMAEGLAGAEDELEFAGARLRLGLAFAMQHRGETALALMLAAQPALEAHADDELLMLLHLGLAVSHLYTMNMSAADVSAREGARRAHRLGETELEAMMLQLVASLGMGRGDAGALSSVHAAMAKLGLVVGSSSELELGELIRRWSAGELPAAAEQAQLIVERHGRDPQASHVVAPARLFLLLAAATERDQTAARLQMAALERLRDEETDLHVAAGLDRIRPVGWALMAAAEGDDESFSNSIDALREEYLRSGAGPMAGHLLGISATWQFGQGRVDVTDDLVVGLLSMLADYRSLPSSAERSGTRHLIVAAARSACEAAIRDEDWQLLSELIETLRAQGIPTVERAARVNALSGLLEVMVSDALGPMAAVPFAQPATETSLPADAQIRMPWGSVALERHRAAARPYIAVTTQDVVSLRILR